MTDYLVEDVQDEIVYGDGDTFLTPPPGYTIDTVPGEPIVAPRAVAVAEPTDSLPALASVLATMRQIMQATAEKAVDQHLRDTGGHLNAMEREAVVYTLMLEYTNAYDFQGLVLRGDLITEMEERKLYAFHPNGYENMDQLLAATGISKSEKSDVLRIRNTIMPYFESRGEDPRALWSRLGKTKFRYVAAHLCTAIDPRHRGSPRVRAQIESLGSEIRKTHPEYTPDQVRDAMADQILHIAETAPSTRELEKTLAGEAENRPDVALFDRPDGKTVLLTVLDGDQIKLWDRKLGKHVEYRRQIDADDLLSACKDLVEP